MTRLPRGDAGSASAFVVVMAVVLMVVAGLVIDGGRALNARSAAMDDAEQAARAGAGAIDVGLLRDTGDVRIDPAAASAAARTFLAAQGWTADQVVVTTDATTVRVTVDGEVPTALLSLVFIRSMPVHGEAVARPAMGVDTEIPLPGGP